MCFQSIRHLRACCRAYINRMHSVRSNLCSSQYNSIVQVYVWPQQLPCHGHLGPLESICPTCTCPAMPGCDLQQNISKQALESHLPCLIQAYARAQRMWILRLQDTAGHPHSTAVLGLAQQSQTCPGARPAWPRPVCSSGSWRLAAQLPSSRKMPRTGWRPIMMPWRPWLGAALQVRASPGFQMLTQLTAS